MLNVAAQGSSLHQHTAELPLSSERPCFRLLELEPVSGQGEEALQAKAATYDLKTPCEIEYDALSYCWGDATLSEAITINGEEFPITRSLAGALRQFRGIQASRQTTAGSAAARKLWVDAVCINQRDNAEKSHQVMLMKDIYANARRVFCWLGDGDEHSDLAFSTLHIFSTASPKAAVDIASSLHGEAAERRAAIRRFVQLPYFFRMWIVQEVVAAKAATLYWGLHSIDFDAACKGIERITGSGFYPFSQETANLSYVGRWRNAYHARGPRADDEELDLRLFLDTRDRSATNPRDKIYSLYGIARPRIAAGIRIDYGDPVEKVFTDFSKHVLRTRPDLQILSAVMVRHAAKSAYGLPSYVPDWTQPKLGGGFLQRYYRFQPTHLFRASRGTRPRVTTAAPGPGGGGDAIAVEGFRVDRVARVLRIKTLLAGGGASGTVVTETALAELAADAVATPTYAATGEPAWLACFRTLTADRSAMSPRIGDAYRSENFARFAGIDLRDDLRPGQAAPPRLPASFWEEISLAVETVVEDKDLFVTEKGYIGLAQETCAVGDVVSIFLGGEVPYIVRPAAGAAYTFFGECYVHGIMDGEAVDDSVALESFVLV